MMSASETRDPIEYLLNAMEHAAQQDRPAEHDYRGKRLAVLAAIRELRGDLARVTQERDEARRDAEQRLAILRELRRIPVMPFPAPTFGESVFRAWNEMGRKIDAAIASEREGSRP